MRKQDKELMDGIEEMIEQAPGVGLCSFPFKIIRDRVAELIEERDSLEYPFKPEYSEDGAELPEVLGFIGRFSTDGSKERAQVLDAFLFGGCFWFAFILKTRFQHTYPCQIVVDYSKNHFACRINGTVYDITGRVRDGAWEYWDDCTDTELVDRITADCIMF